MDGLTGGSRSTVARRFPSCSATGEGARRAHRLPREDARHLARHQLAPVRRAGARRRDGPGQARLQRGDVVSVLANTVPEWLYVDMGTMGAGGVTNGIYPTDSAKQVDYIVNDSRSRFLFVENEEQLDKFLEVRERCPSLTKVFVLDMEGLADFKDPMVMSFERADDARPRVRQGEPWRMGEAGRRVQGRGAGAAGLHFGDDRGAEGRDASRIAT